jgi:hypothetical protein
MKKLQLLLIGAALLVLPFAACAHGFARDGHNAPLTATDYIEVGVVALISLGLIIFSYQRWRVEKRERAKREHEK